MPDRLRVRLPENRFHSAAHAGTRTLLDVFSPFYKPDPAHDMISVFDAEDLSDLFGYSDSSSGYDFRKEGNVFLIDLYRQSDRDAKGSMTQSYNVLTKPKK